MHTGKTTVETQLGRQEDLEPNEEQYSVGPDFSTYTYKNTSLTQA